AGHRVAIVDAEVRRPVQHEIFGMDRSPGLTEWLHSETPTRAVLRPTSLARVDLLSTGQSLDTPGDALVARGPQVRALLDELRTRYEVVFVDAPPILVVHDTTLLARLADCVLFVVRPNRADQDLLSRARTLLTGAGARVIGCAMNHVDPTALYGYKNYTYEAPRRSRREPAPRTAD